MKLNKEHARGMIEVYLLKEGYTLQDLENYLQNPEITKTAEPAAAASAGPRTLTGLPKSLLNALKFITMATATMGAIGGVGGIAAYGIDKQLQNSDKKIDDSNETRRKIEAATREIEALKQQQSAGVF